MPEAENMYTEGVRLEIVQAVKAQVDQFHALIDQAATLLGQMQATREKAAGSGACSEKDLSDIDGSIKLVGGVLGAVQKAMQQ